MNRRKILISLATLGLSATGLFAYRSLSRPTYEGAALSVEDALAKAQAGEILLVDIRQPEEWQATGIAAPAIPVDMRRRDFADTVRAALGADRDRPVALICARGVRSARLSAQLSAAGFGTIIDVPEGMLGSPAGPGWLAKGLPIRPVAGTSG